MARICYRRFSWLSSIDAKYSIVTLLVVSSVRVMNSWTAPGFWFAAGSLSPSSNKVPNFESSWYTADAYSSRSQALGVCKPVSHSVCMNSSRLPFSICSLLFLIKLHARHKSARSRHIQLKQWGAHHPKSMIDRIPSMLMNAPIAHFPSRLLPFSLYILRFVGCATSRAYDRAVAVKPCTYRPSTNHSSRIHDEAVSSEFVIKGWCVYVQAIGDTTNKAPGALLRFKIYTTRNAIEWTLFFPRYISNLRFVLRETRLMPIIIMISIFAAFCFHSFPSDVYSLGIY